MSTHYTQHVYREIHAETFFGAINAISVASDARHEAVGSLFSNRFGLPQVQKFISDEIRTSPALREVPRPLDTVWRQVSRHVR